MVFQLSEGVVECSEIVCNDVPKTPLNGDSIVMTVDQS